MPLLIPSPLGEPGFCAGTQMQPPTLSCPSPGLPASALEPTLGAKAVSGLRSASQGVLGQIPPVDSPSAPEPPASIPPTSPPQPLIIRNGPITSQQTLPAPSPITQGHTAGQPQASDFKGGPGDP